MVLKWGKIIFVAVLTISMLVSFSGFTVKAESTNIFYVDFSNGNDRNAGTSEHSAWKTLDKINNTTFNPGDKILFKAGEMWVGQLWPKGSGSQNNPIIIDMYGEGNRPIINGKRTTGEILKLYNQQYWEINNLEISANYDDAFKRIAVNVVAKDYGTLNHVHLKNLYIHDVVHNIHYTNSNEGKDTGGIIFQVKGDSTPTKFNDVLVEGCSLYRIDRSGIQIASSPWNNRDGVYGGCGDWLGHTNVIIRNNSLNNVGGDGIVTWNCQGSIAEYNVVSDYNNNNQGTQYSAGIWPWACNDALFQYNEGYLGRTTRDGMPWDCDALCDRTVYQYNYSHDNEGGCLLLISTGKYRSRDSVFRYNISQNDRFSLISSSGPDNAKIYNNVFYTGEGTKTNIFNTNYGTIDFKNNIFYNKGRITGGWAAFNYDSNVYYGNYSSTPNDNNKTVEDPKFLNPGSGEIGRNTAEGYKLKADSPCIDAGTEIADNGGIDFWGNDVAYNGITDIGAYEFQGTQEDVNIENYIKNPGFESGNNVFWNVGWGTYNVVNNNQYEGNYAVRVNRNAAAEQVITGLIPNTTYKLNAWVKVDDANSKVYLGVKEYGNPEKNIEITSTNYTQQQLIFTTGKDSTTARIYLYRNTSGNGYAFGDNFKVTRK